MKKNCFPMSRFFSSYNRIPEMLKMSGYDDLILYLWVASGFIAIGIYSFLNVARLDFDVLTGILLCRIFDQNTFIGKTCFSSNQTIIFNFKIVLNKRNELVIPNGQKSTDLSRLFSKTRCKNNNHATRKCYNISFTRFSSHRDFKTFLSNLVIEHHLYTSSRQCCESLRRLLS